MTEDLKQRLNRAYSGWGKHAQEVQAAPVAAQLDIEAEIERRVAERMAHNVVEMPKKKKKSEDAPE